MILILFCNRMYIFKERERKLNYTKPPSLIHLDVAVNVLDEGEGGHKGDRPEGEEKHVAGEK